MRVGINLTHLNPGQNGGIEHYIRSLVYCFPKVIPYHEYIIFALRNVIHTIDEPEQYEIVEVQRSLQDAPSITKDLKKWITILDIDIWWSPMLILDPLDIDIPCAFFIPDMQHEYFPEFFNQEALQWRREHLQASALRANIIFTPSLNSKRDIIKFLKVAREKVSISDHDVAPWFKKEITRQHLRSSRYKYSLPLKYLFYPANTWPHKNHITLLKALKILLRQYPDLKLVLTGQKVNAHKDIVTFIEKSDLKNQVLFLGLIAREDMPCVYALAQMLVFPSLFEGFGIPLVEAMYTQCPIVAATSTSIPEVAQDAALYFDPLDEFDMAQKIKHVLNDTEIRQTLIQNGIKRKQSFSYERCAKATIHKLEDVYYRNEIYMPFQEHWPKVSIVTPSYNQGKYIEETIQSVIRQNYPNLEYIIIDGGSTDQSLAIIKKYADQYPHIIRWISEKDKGQTDAINKGFKMSHGEILAWINSDDVYQSGAIHAVVEYFRSHSQIYFVHGLGHHIREDGAFIENYPSKSCDFRSLYYTCSICQPTAFWRRIVLDQMGYLDDSLHYVMDYDYWIKISQAHRLGFLSQHLASTRFYADTKTSRDRVLVHLENLKIIHKYYGKVSSSWIYALGHAILHKLDRNKRWEDRIFVIGFVLISIWAFRKYNGNIPNQEKLRLKAWFKTALNF